MRRVAFLVVERRSTNFAVEDAVVVICQAIPVLMLGCHPITYWAFAVLWVVCLIDEHSGHDVWWSPYQLLPFTGSPMGGGENYTM